MTDKEDFLNWLNKTAPVLRGRSPDEIAYFARINGFDIATISEILPQWWLDQLTHTKYEHRENWQIGREIRYAEERAGKADLREQWFKLWRYEKGSDYDDE